jgi:hypothetical protein
MATPTSKTEVDPDIAQSEALEEMPGFFEAVGEAMANWQNLETSMFAALHALLKTDYRTSALVFFHIRSADSKLELLSKLVNANVGKEGKDRWKGMYKGLKDARTVRDSLAHFEIRFVSNPPNSRHFPVLAPHSLDYHVYEIKQGNVRLYTKETLVKFGDGFMGAAHDVIRFSAAHIPMWRAQLARLPSWLRRRLERVEALYSGQEPPASPGSSPPLPPPVSPSVR